MLRKNIYILYPAGYFGTYINWAINISDSDLAKNTVKDPINKEANDERGGAGTSHLHAKIPTHQSFISHVAWVMYNKPSECKIYNINQGIDSPVPAERFISIILNSDPTAIFINIHNNLDNDITNFGNINAMTKWPTQMSVRQLDNLVGEDSDSYIINPFDCVDDLNFRNLVVTNKKILRSQIPINRNKLSSLVDRDLQWYNLRNKLHPHEVNEDTYINPSTYINNDNYLSRIFELSCLDVVKDSFPDFLSKFLSDSGVSSDFNTNHVQNFHHEFIKAQSNLQWFESIEKWRQTSELDDFLKSHMGIQGMVIAEMFKRNPTMKNTNWRSKSIEKLNSLLTNSGK
jgi:hypothetical protein